MISLAPNRQRRLRVLLVIGALLIGAAVTARARHSQRARPQPTPAALTTTAPVTAAPIAAAPVAAPLPATPAEEPTSAAALTQRLRENPRDRAARYRLAHLYFQEQDYSRSLQELRVLEQQDPRDPGVLLRRAVVLKSQGRPDAAEAAVRRALGLQPGNPQAELLLGDIHLDQREYQKARTVFDRHLRTRPGSLAALMGKARALERLYLAQEPVKIAEMLEPVEMAASLAPNNPRVLSLLAKMKFAYLVTPEETAAAEAAALRAAQLDPRDPAPYVTLAQIYLARGPGEDNIRKVAEYAARAGALNLNDPRPPYLIGRVALLRNDPEGAVKALELSLSRGPMPETVLQLAAAHRRAGNTRQAGYYAGVYQRYSDLLARRDALQASRQRQPREPRHCQELARVYLDAGDPETATHWLDEAQRLRPSAPAQEQLRKQVTALRKKGSNAPLLRVP